MQDQIRLRPTIIVVPALRWSRLNTTDRAVSNVAVSGSQRTASEVAVLPTEVTRDVAGFVGRDLANAPRHKKNVWVRYRFPEGRLEHLMLAIGVVRVSDRFIAADNVTIAPAYTRLDASGSYELSGPRLKLGAAVQNVTDVRYVTSGAGGALWAGAPRRVVV